MAFAAGRSAVLGAGVPVPLPVATDMSNWSPNFTLYSHMRVPGGTTYTFDSGQSFVIPAATDTVIAIPVNATTVTATAASTALYGQSL
jgi:hypothetical protein